MQVFLPYPSFRDSAIALDPRRRHKQVLENAQIIRAATEPGAPWASHCVTRAWAAHVRELEGYSYLLRTIYAPPHSPYITNLLSKPEGGLPYAWWFNHPEFHRGHRGHLYRKDPKYYALFVEDKDFPLLYPTMTEGVFAERVAPGRFRRWGVPGARVVRRVPDVLL